MKPGTTKSAVIDGKRYNPQTATLLSGDDYWDGSNYERRGTNTFLFRTPRGAYFSEYLTCWQGDRSCLTPLTESEAIELYEEHQQKGNCREEFEDAFPGVEIEEA